ncbi:hypothetical protein B0H66DRAFT_533528 [Apodospora peruviana]|uniref:Uncharacterized protein n=1 Tax=Apodospora peruviana TaxID=516989 RepID=A0AAE0M4U3_9PEZI|nr:hypothetical protein B0H66DRAFT_533528 [Apodospora peruviana]
MLLAALQPLGSLPSAVSANICIQNRNFCFVPLPTKNSLFPRPFRNRYGRGSNRSRTSYSTTSSESWPAYLLRAAITDFPLAFKQNPEPKQTTSVKQPWIPAPIPAELANAVACAAHASSNAAAAAVAAKTVTLPRSIVRRLKQLETRTDTNHSLSLCIPSRV